MSKDFGQGIFDMEFINHVGTIKDVIAAKKAAIEKIDGSPATDKNKKKASAMVHKSRTVTELLFGMTNFSLSHQGLKRI